MQVVANDSRKLSPGTFAIASLICEAPNQARSSRPLFDNCPLSASNGVLGRRSDRYKEETHDGQRAYGKEAGP